MFSEYEAMQKCKNLDFLVCFFSLLQFSMWLHGFPVAVSGYQRGPSRLSKDKGKHNKIQWKKIQLQLLSHVILFACLNIIISY